MNAVAHADPGLAPPRESLGRLFLRFLKFGSLAWAPGGADRDDPRSGGRGEVGDAGGLQPRASLSTRCCPARGHELCVYFGTRQCSPGASAVSSRGGLQLPGFVLMFLLSWLYLRHGLQTTGTFATGRNRAGGVAALIVRAIHRIAGTVLADRWLWGLAILAGAAQLANVHFAFILVATGSSMCFAPQRPHGFRDGLSMLCVAGVAVLGLRPWRFARARRTAAAPAAELAQRSHGSSFSRSQAGMLTFSRAYPVDSVFLQEDAVTSGGLMTERPVPRGLARVEPVAVRRSSSSPPSWVTRAAARSARSCSRPASSFPPSPSRSWRTSRSSAWSRSRPSASSSKA